MKVVVPLADGVEEMEAVIIIDVLRRAGWEVTVAGLTGETVTASRGVKLMPDVAWADVDARSYEMIVLPGGGPGTQRLAEDDRLRKALTDMASADCWVCAICAAPTVLSAAGLLKDKKATCYPGMEDQLDAAETLEDRVVIDGRIVTSRGPGTAMEFALALVEQVEGADKARELAGQMVALNACC